MSVELQDTIRKYATWVESTQEPVTTEEIMRGPDDTRPMARPAATRPIRGPWPALVAAAVVVVIFGVFLWVFPSEGPLPPAEPRPGPEQSENAYYITNAVPEGFGLRIAGTAGRSRLVYVRDMEGTWMPPDGAFAIEDPYGVAVGGLPESNTELLDLILDSVTGSSPVTIGGRPGAMFETQLRQDGLEAPLIWVLGFDDEGGVFEVSAVGMTSEEVLGVADGVHRITVGEFVEVRSHIDWDVWTSEVIVDGFRFEPPSEVVELSEELEVAIGLDLLWSRLAHAGQGDTTVVTTDSGQIVESGGEPIRAMTADMFLVIEEGTEGQVLAARPDSELSPTLHEDWIDRYVEAVRGGALLSEDPYVMQAGEGPEPMFDPNTLGEELSLEAPGAIDVLPEAFFADELMGASPAATEEHPVLVIGTVAQPNSDTPPVTGLVWFTDLGTRCVSVGGAESMASGCGNQPQTRFGVGGESNMGAYNHIDFEVPIGTSVVQIVTASQNYWQRPVAGHGLVAFGDTVGRPTTIIAYDAEGNEIGRWPA